MVMMEFGAKLFVPVHQVVTATSVTNEVASVVTSWLPLWAMIFYCVIYTLFTIGFLGFTHYIIRRGQTMPAGLGTGAPAVWPGVSLIRPVYGADENSESCFRTCLDQDYPGPVEYLFCLQRDNDPALPLLHRLCAEYTQRWVPLNARMSARHANSGNGNSGPWRQFRVLVHPVREGFNGKTSNLYTGEISSSQPIVVFQDSDLVLESKWFIRQTVMALRNYDCVYSPTRWIHTENRWARIYAFMWNLTMLTLHCTCTMLGSPIGLAGPTMAMPRRVLMKIGGVTPAAQYNCEDMVLGENLMKQGFTIGLGPLVSSPVGSMKFGTMYQNMLRGTANSHRAGFKSQVGVLVYVGYFFGMMIMPFVTMTPSLWGLVAYFCVLKQGSLLLSGLILSGEPYVTPIDIIMGEFLVLATFFQVLIFPTFRWGGQLWHVDIATAKMTPLTSKTPAPAPSPTSAASSPVPCASPELCAVSSSTGTSNSSSSVVLADPAMLLPSAPSPSLSPSPRESASVSLSLSSADVSRAFVCGYVFAMTAACSTLVPNAVAALLAASEANPATRAHITAARRALQQQREQQQQQQQLMATESAPDSADSADAIVTSEPRVEVVEEVLADDVDVEDDGMMNTTTTTTTTTTTIVRTPLPLLPTALTPLSARAAAGPLAAESRARGCSMQDMVDEQARARKIAEQANRCVHDHVLRLRRSSARAVRSRSSSASSVAVPAAALAAVRACVPSRHAVTTTQVRNLPQDRAD